MCDKELEFSQNEAKSLFHDQILSLHILDVNHALLLMKVQIYTFTASILVHKRCGKLNTCTQWIPSPSFVGVGVACLGTRLAKH